MLGLLAGQPGQPGGGHKRVTSLFKPNLDAHDYEPSPADVEAIAQADLVLGNGAGLETWLRDTITSSGFRGPVVDTSQGVRLRQVGGQPDPQIWQSPRNAEVMAANLQRAGMPREGPGRCGSSDGTLPRMGRISQRVHVGSLVFVTLSSAKALSRHRACPPCRRCSQPRVRRC
jgi:Zinc-uptake complex component A periplasmic